jgi:protein gp37
MTLAKRLKAMGQPKYQQDGDPRTSGPGFAVTTHDAALALPQKWLTPRMVFVNSMSDLFHDDIPLAFIQSVFRIMVETPQHTYQLLTKRSRRLQRLSGALNWPPNVWIGVSVESDKYLFRVDHLREVPAAVRFLSLEPLLGPLPRLSLDGIGWVIVGGESGPASRPVHLDWVTSIRDKCRVADVPFFFKQWGGRTPKAGGRHLQGRTWDEMPPQLRASL